MFYPFLFIYRDLKFPKDATLLFIWDGNALRPREPNTAQQKQADKTLETKVITFINADGCKQSNQGQT